MGSRFHDNDMGFDPIDTLSDVVDEVGDVASSVVEAVPGGSLITGAVSDFVEGPMRDFARTPLGETIFRASSIVISQSLYVLPVIGYTIGFLAWAVPGLAKGEKFNEALAKEFVYRVEYVASVFVGKAGGEGVKAGVNKMMGDQMQRATNTLSEQAAKIGITPQALIAKSGFNASTLARLAGVREDVASYAIEWFRGSNPQMFALINKAYNPDGTMKDAVKKALTTKMNYPANTPCANLAALKAKGMTEENTRQNPALNAAFRSVQAQCEEWQLNEAIRLSSTPAGPTLNKRTLTTAAQKAAAALLPKKNPEEIYEAAVKAGQKPAILNMLKAKAEAWRKAEDARLAAAAAQAQPPNTLAGSAAVTYTPTATVDAAVASAESESNKKSAVAGAVSGFVGAGAALLAGLSAGVAVPVGLGFAAGGAIATKLLTKPKVAAG